MILKLNVIIKYILIVGLFYLILKNIPSNELNIKDIILISLILVIILFIFDNINNNILSENLESTPPYISQPAATTASTTKPTATKGAASPAGDMNTSMNSTDDIFRQSVINHNVELTKYYDYILQNDINNKSLQTNIKSNTLPPKISSHMIIPSQTIESTTQNNDCQLALNNLTNQFNSKINNLQMQLQLVNNSTTSNISLNYYNDLVNQLLNKGIITNDDIQNIKIKVQNKLLTINDVIKGLEILNNSGVSKNTNYNMSINSVDNLYTPIGDKIANDWNNSYTILDSSKWMVPMPRPPVCINNSPCKICPMDETSYPVSLQSWDNSRNITQSTN